MKSETFRLQNLNIDSKYVNNLTLIKSVIPNRKKLPYYRALKIYLHHQLLEDHPELEDEFVRRVQILNHEDQLLTDAFLCICESSDELLRLSDISPSDLKQIELEIGFQHLVQQLSNN